MSSRFCIRRFSGRVTPCRAPTVAVYDDDACDGGKIGLEVGIGPLGVGEDDGHARIVETASERAILNEKFDLEAGHQDFVEHPDDQLVLADGETPHWRVKLQLY